MPTTNRYLEAARRIPPGETRTFLELAAMAGRPGAARAAGRALSACPIGSPIPWHRVVAADGKPGAGRRAEQLRRLRREGARPRDREPVAAWAQRRKATLLGRLPARTCLPASDPRTHDWPPLQVEPLRDEATALSRGFAPPQASAPEPLPSTERPARRTAGVRPAALRRRCAAIDWEAACAALSARGLFHIPGLMTPSECEALSGLWPRPERFDRTVIMGPKGYGIGEYRYWVEPLPEPARSLRRLLYTRLRDAAERQRPRGASYPGTLPELWRDCRGAGQQRPSSILLRYGAGGINHPHRDIYGKIWFPFQALVVLSRAGRDFAGGEFAVLEEHRNGEEHWRSVPATQGDLVVFCARERWEEQGGRRRRVELRHAMSLITRGERFALGIVFPLAD